MTNDEYGSLGIVLGRRLHRPLEFGTRHASCVIPSCVGISGFVIVLACMSVLIGCAAPQDATRSVTLATTTSTRDTGLLDTLLPLFTQQTGIDVKAVAVGTGQALEIGRRGDADVLLTHAPDAEQQFVADGFGEHRREVMFNDFVLVGPATDPAQVTGQAAIADALRQIAQSQSTFVSRGDESGTHLKEKSLWDNAGITPQGDWYLAAGSGMADTLRVASEKRGYTLSDRGTYLSQQDVLDLVVLSDGDPLLRNVYSVIVVSPTKHPHVHHDAACQLAEFLAAPDVQRLIGEFGVDKYGQPLFTPLVVPLSIPVTHRARAQ